MFINNVKSKLKFHYSSHTIYKGLNIMSTETIPKLHEVPLFFVMSTTKNKKIRDTLVSTGFRLAKVLSFGLNLLNSLTIDFYY